MSDPNDAENYLAHPVTNAAMEDAAEIERLWADLKDSHTEIERLREGRADSTYDGTDAAHPAWWRGHDHTTTVICKKIHHILDGEDDGRGSNYEEWGSVRERLLGLVGRIEELENLVECRDLALVGTTDYYNPDTHVTISFKQINRARRYVHDQKSYEAYHDHEDCSLVWEAGGVAALEELGIVRCEGCAKSHAPFRGPDVCPDCKDKGWVIKCA